MIFLLLLVSSHHLSKLVAPVQELRLQSAHLISLQLEAPHNVIIGMAFFKHCDFVLSLEDLSIVVLKEVCVDLGERGLDLFKCSVPSLDLLFLITTGWKYLDRFLHELLDCFEDRLLVEFFVDLVHEEPKSFNVELLGSDLVLSPLRTHCSCLFDLILFGVDKKLLDHSKILLQAILITISMLERCLVKQLPDLLLPLALGFQSFLLLLSND